ncbi:MAG: hypothetical protein CFH21_01122 [Alphaproteobacteria bacterium MarineAlpha5_Bin11]|nr:GNAT family N-acetyltransferase [Pelagibacteraceae bacterium]PPR42407.1 MAG: hypothetical protein CFH21_01122 [Alphaproteobacteria bacterium MarineAlpha5_Bin11]PPR51464.1 MAG: hypothetical protein CFH20_00529 [Alphaproteobacteria bacterium MarineAlpha5_Bin10]|tara:strand:+ start:19 stop:471 length:453 start_codon:yes stop_codon:yes gene_type:complete
MKFKIIRATLKNANNVGSLFDLYRQFYSYKSDINTSTKYIEERIKNYESIIFLAIDENNTGLGFVQLYETFGSLDLGKIIVLYDLYVKKEFRKNKIGKELMLKSHDYAKSVKAKRIQLSTATDNFIGQSLYESLGYVKDINFYTYDFEIN